MNVCRFFFRLKEKKLPSKLPSTPHTHHSGFKVCQYSSQSTVHCRSPSLWRVSSFTAYPVCVTTTCIPSTKFGYWMGVKNQRNGKYWKDYRQIELQLKPKKIWQQMNLMKCWTATRFLNNSHKYFFKRNTDWAASIYSRYF